MLPPPPIPPAHPLPPAESDPPSIQVPIARTPFDPEWPVHSMGLMNLICSSCHALHWKDERLAKSSIHNPKFGKCCLNGKITLPALDPPPPELQNLLTS